MESSISVLELRRHLGQALDKVSCGRHRLLVSKRGRLQAVIISPEEYFSRIVPAVDEVRDLQREAVERGLDGLTDRIIEEELRAVRKRLESTP
jgi:prevent-host-death family protein